MTSIANADNIRKGFVKPMTFRFGSLFNNKSEEKRFCKMSDPIIKLRHLLINDPVNSHDYILKFLRQYFTLAQIGKFEDSGLRNFIQCVVAFKGLTPNINVKEFILSCLYGELSNTM